MTIPSEELINKSIVDQIITREGGFVNAKDDHGGATIYGVSQRSNPEMWKDGPPTKDQARELYLQRYLVGPGFDKIADIKLRHQMTDFAIHSGPSVAIQKLQAILGVAVDGSLGPATIEAILKVEPRTLNNQLVAARVKMIGQIVVKNPSQLKWLNGFLNRALEFLA